MEALLFKVPDDTDGTGLFVGGGWLSFSDHPEHGRVLVVPAAGDYSMLSGLGYQAVVSTPTPTPDAENPAAV